ncbi:hypothetical protein HYD53_00880 [Mycoplasmopsis bovis]|nr:hypothetical protein [Mycoplasmopsis bovis]QQH72012.1 hypothetical protein HYD53_00880 [Mycoplasmopsis bovis]
MLSKRYADPFVGSLTIRLYFGVTLLYVVMYITQQILKKMDGIIIRREIHS